MCKWKKTNLAKEQLEDGIDIFFHKRYVSSLTLLRAATEIFEGMIAEGTGYHPSYSGRVLTNRIRSYYGTAHISKGKLKAICNSAKNTVKHHDIGDPRELCLIALAKHSW